MVAEVAVRSRRTGRACHAVVGEDALGRERTAELGLASVLEAGTIAELEAAGRALATR